jgi:hypothetical protein
MSATAHKVKKDERVSVLDRGKDMGIEVGTAMAGLPGMPREYSGWDVYNNEAKIVDTELVNDWRGSLKSLLLFVWILSRFLPDGQHLTLHSPPSLQQFLLHSL